MQCLKDNAEIATGDPIYCESCQAIFNKFSQVEEIKDTTTDKIEQIWNCEFCCHKNKVQIEPEEIPKSDAVNYILEAAPYVEEKKESTVKGEQSQSEISVVYCIDISGSMGYRAGEAYSSKNTTRL